MNFLEAVIFYISHLFERSCNSGGYLISSYQLRSRLKNHGNVEFNNFQAMFDFTDFLSHFGPIMSVRC